MECVAEPWDSTGRVYDFWISAIWPLLANESVAIRFAFAVFAACFRASRKRIACTADFHLAATHIYKGRLPFHASIDVSSILFRSPRLHCQQHPPSIIHHPSSTIHELALFSNSSTPVSCHHCIIAVSGAGYLATSLPTDISWLLSGCCVVSSITSATIEHFLRPNLHVLFLCLCRHPTEPPLSSMPSHSTCAPHSRNLTSSYPVCSKQFIHSSHISPATPLSFQFFSVSPQYPPSAAPAPSSFEP